MPLRRCSCRAADRNGPYGMGEYQDNQAKTGRVLAGASANAVMTGLACKGGCWHTRGWPKPYGWGEAARESDAALVGTGP